MQHVMSNSPQYISSLPLPLLKLSIVNLSHFSPFIGGILASSLHMPKSSESLSHILSSIEATSTLSQISSFLIYLLLECPLIHLNFHLNVGVFDWPTLCSKYSRSNLPYQIKKRKENLLTQIHFTFILVRSMSNCVPSNIKST